MQENMTKKEWLIHMLNGVKGTSDRTEEEVYITFDSKQFRYSTGQDVNIDSHTSDFGIYEEPEFTYPMWFKSTTSELLVKFTSLTTCEISIGTDFWDVGEITKMLKPHTNTKFWTQVPEPKKRIKVAKYRFLYQNHWEDSTRYYKSIEHFLLDVTGTTNITRLQETEIEVEDY